jgi:hypothetical protein
MFDSEGSFMDPPKPEVKVYEYMVPGSAVRPPRTAYPTPPAPAWQPATMGELLFARWLHRRYGAR